MFSRKRIKNQLRPAAAAQTIFLPRSGGGKQKQDGQNRKNMCVHARRWSCDKKQTLLHSSTLIFLSHKMDKYNCGLMTLAICN